MNSLELEEVELALNQNRGTLVTVPTHYGIWLVILLLIQMSGGATDAGEFICAANMRRMMFTIMTKRFSILCANGQPEIKLIENELATPLLKALRLIEYLDCLATLSDEKFCLNSVRRLNEEFPCASAGLLGDTDPQLNILYTAKPFSAKAPNSSAVMPIDDSAGISRRLAKDSVEPSVRFAMPPHHGQVGFN